MQFTATLLKEATSMVWAACNSIHFLLNKSSYYLSLIVKQARGYSEHLYTSYIISKLYKMSILNKLLPINNHYGMILVFRNGSWWIPSHLVTAIGCIGWRFPLRVLVHFFLFNNDYYGTADWTQPGSDCIYWKSRRTLYRFLSLGTHVAGRSCWYVGYSDMQ